MRGDQLMAFSHIRLAFEVLMKIGGFWNFHLQICNKRG